MGLLCVGAEVVGSDGLLADSEERGVGAVSDVGPCCFDGTFADEGRARMR